MVLLKRDIARFTDLFSKLVSLVMTGGSGEGKAPAAGGAPKMCTE